MHGANSTSDSAILSAKTTFAEMVQEWVKITVLERVGLEVERYLSTPHQ